MPGYLHQILKFSMISSLMSCGGNAVQTNTDSLVSEAAVMFGGVGSVERQPMGGWLISWTPLDTSGGVYGVYVGESELAVNFEEPLFTTAQGFYNYNPENLLSESKRCFAVRVMGTRDKNTKTLCNDATPSTFAGLSSLEVQSNASYLLSWVKLPVNDAVYWVFESKGNDAFNFDQPSIVTTADFHQTDTLPRGVQSCFVVRVNHPKYGKDMNTIKKCTTLEPVIEFSATTAGISLGSPTAAQVNISWNRSSTPGVVGYKVFRDYGCSLQANCLINYIDNRAVCQDSGLQNDLPVYYCLVAVDAANRESEPVFANPITPNGGE